MHQSWLTRSWSSSQQLQNQWLKESVTLSLTACLSLAHWAVPLWDPGWQNMCHLQPGQPCSRGREHGFHPEVRHVTSTHILPANASHTATPDLRGAGVCSFDLAMPQKEESQRTAFLMTTFGVAFPRMLLQEGAQSPFSVQCTCMKMQRKCTRLCYILLF